jgi:hypothetical protein
MTPAGVHAPLILTARLDPEAFALLDALRRRHFPPERNHLSAHLTLFHQLPGEEEAAVRAGLEAVARRTPAIEGRADRILPLGRGVAVGIDAPGLVAIRAQLAERWAGRLTPQDRGRLRPHVTVQNKVTAAAARELHAALAAGFEPFPVRIEGLLLWRYLGGPWAPVASVPFPTAGEPGRAASS